MRFTNATSTPGIEFIPRFHLHYFDEFFQADFFGIFPLKYFLWSGQSQCFPYDITSSRVVVCSNKPSHCCIVHTSCGGIYNTVVRFTRFPSGGFTIVTTLRCQINEWTRLAVAMFSSQLLLNLRAKYCQLIEPTRLFGT